VLLGVAAGGVDACVAEEVGDPEVCARVLHGGLPPGASSDFFTLLLGGANGGSPGKIRPKC